MKVEGRVIDVRKSEQSFIFLKQGIKRQNQGKYARNPNMHGSNGTYRIGSPMVNRSLSLVVKVPGVKHQFIDVREEFLRLNDRQKVTGKTVNDLKEHLRDKPIEVDLISDGKAVLLNKEVLKMD